MGGAAGKSTQLLKQPTDSAASPIVPTAGRTPGALVKAGTRKVLLTLAGAAARGSSYRESRVRETQSVKITTRTINQYRYLLKKKPLGTGASSTVFLVEDKKTKEKFALKEMKRSTLRQIDAVIGKGSEIDAGLFTEVGTLVEVAILKKLRHPNLVRLHEVIDDPNSDRHFLVMEYVRCSRKRLLSPDESEGYARTRGRIGDVLAGLAFLHGNLMCHRDIKPENCLEAEDGTVKVSHATS